MNMKLKTRGKLLVLIISTIILFSILANTIIYFQFSSFITNNTLRTNANLAMQLIEQKYQGDWSIVNNELYKGEKIINNDTEIVDSIRRTANVQCTIFLKDTRVTTTIMENNKRAVGTKANAKVVKKVLQENSQYIGDVPVLNVLYKAVYIPISNKSGATIGMMFIGIEERIIDQQVSGIVLLVLIATVILIILSVIIAMFFASRVIIKPITYIKEHLNLVSAGNLSIAIEDTYLTKNDEFGEIARSIEETQESIKRMIHTIKLSSENIDNQSESLRFVSNEMEAASSTVTRAIQEITTGAGEQSEQLVKISTITTEFGDLLENIIKAIDEVNRNSNDINDMANASNGDMSNLAKSITAVKNAFNDFANKIADLGININRINEISNFINGIAGQTNLLALNANIEAARAGEAGKGFAVVASQIRKLAEESKSSSESINAIISDIAKNSESMISTSKEMSDELTNEMGNVDQAIKSFDSIVKAINAVIPKIEEINHSSLSILKDKNQIIKNIEEVTSVSQQVSATTEEISASSEEMNASTEEVASAAKKLSDMTKDMLGNVNYFKL